MELLNIIDAVASVEDDSHVGYNYLGFASVLSRMIGNEERARYYKGQMAVAQMLHRFAVTNDVDDQKLKELHKVNQDILRSNYNLRHQFYRLLAVSLMGGENTEWLVAMTKEETDENLRKLASLVYPPNTMKSDIEKQTYNIMKELCAFLNYKRGVLYIGVNNEGGGEGLEEDMKHEYFQDSKDKYDNYVRNQIVQQLGQEASHCIEGRFDDDARGRDHQAGRWTRHTFLHS